MKSIFKSLFKSFNFRNKVLTRSELLVELHKTLTKVRDHVSKSNSDEYFIFEEDHWRSIVYLDKAIEFAGIKSESDEVNHNSLNSSLKNLKSFTDLIALNKFNESAVRSKISNPINSVIRKYKDLTNQ